MTKFTALLRKLKAGIRAMFRKLDKLLRKLARRTGLGCWCCGAYGRNVMFYVWDPLMTRTWCVLCKVGGCDDCDPHGHCEDVACPGKARCDDPDCVLARSP